MPSFTITITTEQVQRIRDAFTYVLPLVDEAGEPRDATVDDVKAYVVEDLRQFVNMAERNKAIKDYVAADSVDIT